MISNFIFKLDMKLSYIFVYPKFRVDEFNFNNSIINLIYFLKKKKYIQLIKLLIILFFYLIINLSKIIYLPIIIIIYFTKYRFAQISYTQIGHLNELINFMTKRNYINGYKTIYLIPNDSDFYFISRIFKKLIIINNIFLNLILLPLKYSSFISCKRAKYS